MKFVPFGGRVRQAVLVGIAVAIVAALALRSLLPGSEATKSGSETPIASAMKAVHEGGDTQLIVSPAAVRAAGITVASLKQATIEPGVSAFATALQPQTLLEQRRAILAADAEAARARAAVAAADVQAHRLRSLNADNAIVSKRELEAGQVAAATERAGAQTTTSQVALLEASAARQWGPVIARWLVSGSSKLDRVSDGSALLLQIAPTHEVGVISPTSVYLEPPQGGRLVATIVSASPQADPQFQTRTFFALLPANAQLLPGMTLPARIPTGRPVQGAEIPSAAIVRWNGGSYVYVSIGGNRFVRRPVATNLATPAGWIDATFKPGTQVVTGGAQLLLSEEIRASGARGGADR